MKLFVSKLPPSCGEVSSTTSDIPVPIANVSISGFVPSFAVAKTILSPLSVAENVKESPDPDAY